MRTAAVALTLALAGCMPEVVPATGSGPPSLAVAPPWMYSRRPPAPARPPAPRPQPYVPATEPAARPARSESPALLGRLDDLQRSIEEVRKELTP